LARNGLCKQGLAGPRRPNQQYPFGNTSPEALRFLRIFQELDDFLKLTFGFINSSYIIKAYLYILLTIDFHSRFAQGKHTLGASTHFFHQKKPDENEEYEGQKP